MSDSSSHHDENGDADLQVCKWQVVTMCVSGIWRHLAGRGRVCHARPAMKSPGYKTAPDESG